MDGPDILRDVRAAKPQEAVELAPVSEASPAGPEGSQSLLDSDNSEVVRATRRPRCASGAPRETSRFLLRLQDLRRLIWRHLVDRHPAIGFVWLLRHWLCLVTPELASFGLEARWPPNRGNGWGAVRVAKDPDASMHAPIANPPDPAATVGRRTAREGKPFILYHRGNSAR